MLNRRDSIGLTGLAVVLLMGAGALAKGRPRIDLVEFGRVVELPDAPVKITTAADELPRGADGWDAVEREDGEYTIGVEWDEPRDLSEVNIEFRHAIANREKIKVQYFKPLDAQGRSGQAGDRKPSQGRWLTPKAEWWAGDRDVSFAFAPQDEETADASQPGVTYRGTSRLRFLCGKDELPPVRYLRAYGPGETATDTFDLRFEAKARIGPPVMVRIVNGYILSSDGKTTMESAVLHEGPAWLRIHYFRDEAPSANHTRVMISPVDKPDQEVTVLPAEVARRGTLGVADSGVTVARRGGKVTATRPADKAPPTDEPSTPPSDTN